MKVVLAYSGGLDTSTILVLLRKRLGADVVTVTVDVGQEDDMRDVEKRAYELGASQHYTIDAKREFVEKYIFRAVKANALYEGRYPLGTALARPLIAEKVAEVAVRERADAVAHGCTGKGNDQVRFDTTLRYFLPPEIKIMAPVREMRLTRETSLRILSEYGYTVPSQHKKYSIDENLWSRSIEGGELDDASVEPPEEVFAWTAPQTQTPDQPLYLDIEFEEGVPVRVGGVSRDPVEMIRYLNRVVGLHGFGRIDMIESRVVGLKSREVYEAPAALTLVEAHTDLERMVLTPRELRFKRLVDEMWSDMVYQGLWVDPMREHLDKVIDSMNTYVTGRVRVRVFKGALQVVGRESPYSLYSREVIDYNRGWYPSDEEARGFITIHSNYALTARRVREKRGA